MIWLLPAVPLTLALGALGLERATQPLRRPGQIGTPSSGLTSPSEIGRTRPMRISRSRTGRRSGDPNRIAIVGSAFPSSPYVPPKGSTMSGTTYRVTEIVGTSSDGLEAAVRNGIARASRTLRGLDWFEVVEIRGAIADGDVASFQVGMKVGFRLEDETLS